jgi:hypothetical protein
MKISVTSSPDREIIQAVRPHGTAHSYHAVRLRHIAEFGGLCLGKEFALSGRIAEQPRAGVAEKPRYCRSWPGRAAVLDVFELAEMCVVFTSGTALFGPIDCVVWMCAHGGIVPMVAELVDGELRVRLRGLATARA